ANTDSENEQLCRLSKVVRIPTPKTYNSVDYPKLCEYRLRKRTTLSIIQSCANTNSENVQLCRLSKVVRIPTPKTYNSVDYPKLYEYRLRKRTTQSTVQNCSDTDRGKERL